MGNRGHGGIIFLEGTVLCTFQTIYNKHVSLLKTRSGSGSPEPALRTDLRLEVHAGPSLPALPAPQPTLLGVDDPSAPTSHLSCRWTVGL